MTVMPKLADLLDQSFDPFEIEKLSTGDADDPYPRIHELREKGTVLKGSYRTEFTDVPDVQVGHLEQYMVLGYDTILKVLTNPEVFGNRGAFQHTLGKSFGRTVTVMDAPEHTRYRKIFQKAFLPNTVAKWGETFVDPVVNRLMGAFIDRGEADLVEEFTHHYPFQVIYSQLQIGQEQTKVFHKLAIAQLLSAIGAPQGPEATEKLGDFFRELLAQRRADPGDDLISHLATVEADGERLPDEVLISFLRQLMNAGGDTTFRGTSVLFTGLLTHPEQWEAVAADRSLIPQAIEEALRWEGPVSNTMRYVNEDTELDGVFLPEGTILNMVLGSANRDPGKYPNPDKFDIFRERKVRNLAFANGPHVCIGQHLARLEMTRALHAILDHTRNMRLDPDKPAPDIRGHLLRVPDHIYVKFDKA
ncbi:MAG: cytochrome P450 [Sphingomonadaceae bacterium]|nr:cytochrome P450 [Sphingomonadaceae bacterium]